MTNLKKWVEKPISENVKEKIKVLLMDDIGAFRQAANLNDHNYRIIVDYLYEWIDICCAYRSSCDIVDIYFMSLDDLDDLRLEEASHLFEDETAVKIIRDRIRPHPGRQVFITMCCETVLRDLGYLKLLRDLFGQDEQSSVSKDDIEKTTRKIIKKGDSNDGNTEND